MGCFFHLIENEFSAADSGGNAEFRAADGHVRCHPPIFCDQPCGIAGEDPVIARVAVFQHHNVIFNVGDTILYSIKIHNLTFDGFLGDKVWFGLIMLDYFQVLLGEDN